jgi:hypothetical protein
MAEMTFSFVRRTRSVLRTVVARRFERYEGVLRFDVAEVYLEGFDRPPIDEHASAQAAGSTSLDVRIAEDLGESSTSGMFADDV